MPESWNHSLAYESLFTPAILEKGKFKGAPPKKKEATMKTSQQQQQQILHGYTEMELYLFFFNFLELYLKAYLGNIGHS